MAPSPLRIAEEIADNARYLVGAGNKLDRTNDCKNTNPVVVAVTDTW
jgi:hypothetical protein